MLFVSWGGVTPGVANIELLQSLEPGDARHTQVGEQDPVPALQAGEVQEEITKEGTINTESEIPKQMRSCHSFAKNHSPAVITSRIQLCPSERQAHYLSVSP